MPKMINFEKMQLTVRQVILNRTKLMENANIGKLKWVILGDFQTFFDDFPTLLREAISPLPIPLSRRMKHISIELEAMSWSEWRRRNVANFMLKHFWGGMCLFCVGCGIGKGYEQARASRSRRRRYLNKICMWKQENFSPHNACLIKLGRKICLRGGLD